MARAYAKMFHAYLPISPMPNLYFECLSALCACNVRMQVWELKDIGLRATQRITQAADPLRLLADISQNFPSLVSSLSRQKVCVCAYMRACLCLCFCACTCVVMRVCLCMRVHVSVKV